MEKQIEDQVEKMRQETSEAYAYAQKLSSPIPTGRKEDQVERMRRETDEAYAYAQELSDQKSKEKDLLERGNENKGKTPDQLIAEFDASFKSISGQNEEVEKERFVTETYREAKESIAANNRLARHIETHCKEFLHASKGKHYPLKPWYREKGNPKIKESLARYPKFEPFLNFVDSISNETRGDTSQDKIACWVPRKDKEGKKVVNKEGKEVMKKVMRYVSSFRVNKNFYHRAKESLDLSEAMIKKFLLKCYEGPVYKRKAKRNNREWLYYDGTWLESPGRPARKIRFLNYEKEGKKFMENLKI